MTRARLGEPLLALLCLALARCTGAADGGDLGSSGQAIIGGSLVDAAESPVVFMRSPEGSCTATFLAPRLIVTARHCVAESTQGSFSCTASGDLVPSSTGAGQLGVDHDPSSLVFFTVSHVATGTTNNAYPDAKGIRVISTNTPTACRDDVAFVLLDRDLPGLVPASIRLGLTQVGEKVSVAGYGITERLEPLALRRASGAEIIGVGPDQPSSETQPAPLRAVRLGIATCIGDSGGPIFSDTTGELVSLISTGVQDWSSPFCSTSDLSTTVGPRLGAYRDLALLAFKAAAGLVAPESDVADSGVTFEASATEDDAEPEATAPPSDAAGSLDELEAGTPAPPLPQPSPSCDGSCSLRATTSPGWAGCVLSAAALVAATRSRRRKR